MFQHRIEDRQQFVHAGREGHFLGFPRALQALIEGADHGIKAGRDNGAHIEHRAYQRSSTPDRASAPQCPTIAIQRCDADEGCDLLVRQHAQLWEIRQQGRGQDGTHTRHTLQQFVFFRPHRALANGLRQRGVGVLQFPFKPRNMRPQTFADWRGGAQEAILLGREHLRPVAVVWSTARPRRVPPHREAAAAVGA